MPHPRSQPPQANERNLFLFVFCHLFVHPPPVVAVVSGLEGWQDRIGRPQPLAPLRLPLQVGAPHQLGSLLEAKISAKVK